MGQRMSSENQAARRAQRKKVTTACGDVYVLGEEEELLGRCWLLASSAASLSPSRWFGLSAKNRAGARGHDRRAFVISPDVLSAGVRSRQPVLRDLGINVHKGLSVCGYQNLTVTAIPSAVAQPQRSFRIGGVHVALPSLPEAYKENPRAPSQYVVMVMRRVSVEADLREYKTALFTRVEVRAPPTTAEERQEYGEGCITGILYGAVVVLHVPASLNSARALAHLCEEAARASGVSPAALVVQEESVSGTVASKSTEGTGEGEDEEASSSALPYVHLLSVEAAPKASSTLMRKCCAQGTEPASDSANIAAHEALKSIATWAVQVHQDPSAWCPLNLFLQRYEAIAESLLVKPKKK